MIRSRGASLPRAEAGLISVIRKSISHDFVAPLKGIYTAQRLIDQKEANAHRAIVDAVAQACDRSAEIEKLVERFVNSDEVQRAESAHQLVLRFRRLVEPEISALKKISGDASTSELAVIQQASVQLGHTVSALLSLSQNFSNDYSDEPTKPSQMARTNVSEFLKRVYSLMSQAALIEADASEQIDFILGPRVGVQHEIKERFVLNQAQIRVALQNLVLNSIKYRDRMKLRTEIYLSASVVRPASFPDKIQALVKDAAARSRWGSKSWLAFTVWDNGLGIDRSEISKVQNINVRGSNVADIPGSGFGLTIARIYAQDHGGFVFVDSVKNKFTEVQLVIPARVAEFSS